MKRVWVRAAALAVVVVALVVGLTVYLSTEKVPACFVEGAPAWRAPADNEAHRYAVVFSDRAACFFDMDDEQRLAGVLRLPEARSISSATPNGDKIAVRAQSGTYTLDVRTGRVTRGGVAPFPSDIVTVTDDEHGVMYVTRRGLLGFRVLDLRNAATLYIPGFKGFTWNRRFGPDPPSHGLSLAPDRPELWVLDAPNSAVHIFDVSELPARPPRPIDDVRLSKPLSGDERECVEACGRIGSLQHSADGRFVYVGDSGDVIDTQTRETVANLEALHNSRVMLEVDWQGGPVFPLLRS
jgi:hypothetical protein